MTGIEYSLQLEQRWANRNQNVVFVDCQSTDPLEGLSTRVPRLEHPQIIGAHGLQVAQSLGRPPMARNLLSRRVDIAAMGIEDGGLLLVGRGAGERAATGCRVPDGLDLSRSDWRHRRQ
jgi:hypothetical protein